MLQKLTTAIATRPAVVVVAAVATLAVVATLAGDAASAVDAPATLGTENGTLVEPTDGVGGTGPPEVGDGDGS